MMKKITLVLMALIAAITLQAQNATTILDKAAATLKSAGNVKIGFSFQAEGSSSSGYIRLQRQKFVINTGGSIIWFDGKTMWTYVKANEEVNVTTPSADAVAKMNPYSFLSFYKNGYTARMGKSTGKNYEVLLTGKKDALYKTVTVHINKSNHIPSLIIMTPQKGSTTTIRCTSFAKNQKYTSSTFQFNQKNYPDVEIVDLR
ncbi:MAG: cell envelope biogenesis protein LolA [Bacteroidales bacterium]|nr:cell envelope biogenesis protein LolA [Bacteroidales bacterium]